MNSFFFTLLYWNHTEPWHKNRGTYWTVMFVYRYTPRVDTNFFHSLEIEFILFVK